MNTELKNIMCHGVNCNNMLARHINIMMSRHFDLISQCVYYMTGKGYTHVSIGLEEDEDTFYSFNGLGFRIEKPIKWKEKDKRIITEIYRLKVDEVTYLKVKKYIEEIKENQQCYKYSFLGLIMSILHIPYERKHRYFCSQFVAEVLRKSSILDKSVKPSMFLPNSFRNLFKVYPFKRVTYC